MERSQQSLESGVVSKERVRVSMERSEDTLENAAQFMENNEP